MKKLFVSLLCILSIGIFLLSCASCNRIPATDPTTTTTATTVPPKPFATARRILTFDDLTFDGSEKLTIQPGEVLVFFTYMKTFDQDAWRTRERPMANILWAAQALNYEASLKNEWYTLVPSLENDGSRVFSSETSYEYGVMANETWMLSEEEYTVAYQALMAAARSAQEKEFWQAEVRESGIYSRHYAKDLSFGVLDYVDPQAPFKEEAEPIYMSTELMREHFQFIGAS